MARGGRELFPPDRGLQVRMGVALAIGVALTLTLIGGLAWFAVAVEKGWSLVGFVAMFALIGAFTARRTPVESPSEVRECVEAIVERLAALADLRAPRVRTDRRAAPLCWTISGPFRGPRLWVTTGLVDRLGEEELTAVVAHELSHVANGDAWVTSVVGGPPTWIAQGVRHMWAEGKADHDWKLLGAAILYGSYSGAVALPGLLTARIVSRHRELAADRGAALLTGNPAALASALRRLSGELARIPKRDLRALGGGDLFYVLPAREPRGLRRLWATHPRLESRLERLEEMERRLQAARPVLGEEPPARA